MNLKIKYSKVKKLERICFYFCEDYTAMHTAKKLGVSRQTINHYYKLLRQRLNHIFLPIEHTIIQDVSQQHHLHIQHTKVHGHCIFFMESKGKTVILEKHKVIKPLFDFFTLHVKEPLCHHKRANCARVLFNAQKQSFLLVGYLTKPDTFNTFLHQRLKQFRGVNKENMLAYCKESQIRYNFHSKVLYQRLIQSLLQD